MRLGSFLTAIAALALCSQALANPVLTPHTAEYKVKISGVSGRLNTELRQTGTGYSANHIVQPTGLVRIIVRGRMDVTSEFEITATGVKPVRFHEIDTIRDEPEVDLEFNWTSNEAFGTVGGDEVRLQLDGIAHDNVSIQYALMHDLLTDNRSDQYTLFDIDKMRIANVSIVGEKAVKTKAGTFTAIGVQHQKEGSSRTTTLWCVKKLDYLPVVIEQHRKGKLNFRASLVNYSPTRE
jgi:hypothetical protein